MTALPGRSTLSALISNSKARTDHELYLGSRQRHPEAVSSRTEEWTLKGMSRNGRMDGSLLDSEATGSDCNELRERRVQAAPLKATPMTSFTSEKERWEAVLRRDAKADGIFYIAVVTTGIYCRPSCAARRPRHENVRFFTSCAAAESAGYRACKRCRPKEQSDPERYARMVASVCRLIEASEALPRLDQLARAAGMSKFHFHRIFKAITGFTPRAYALAHRSAGSRKRA